MPPKPRPKTAYLLLFALSCVCPVSSQEVSQPPSPRIEDAGKETPLPTAKETAVQLSPFEVSSDKDTGFAAGSSLAGGRLATDLRDTPVAYSVVTRDFIDALQITDLGKAANWSTGNVQSLDANQSNFFGNVLFYSTRGFSPSTQARPMRNFFTSFGTGDTYDLDRIDFGRGPNSVLFGNGTLGGVASLTTKRAQTDRPFQEVQASVASWKNYRATVDINQPLADGKAALRTSLVWSDGDGWRYKDFEKRKGIFLTGTVKPFKNTEIRVEGEYLNTSKQVGFTNINDRLSGWDGKTTFNAVAPLATLPANSDALGIGRRGANYFVFDPYGPAKAIMNYQNDPITLSGGATASTPVGGFIQGSLPSFNIANNPFLYGKNVPAGMFDTAIANSFFRPFDQEFTVSPDAPITTQRLKSIELTVTQQFGERIFMEFAVNKNDVYTPGNGEQNRGLPDIFVDINRVLPNGAPNPNYLHPYSDGTLFRQNFSFGATSARLAAAYVMKPNRLGNFTFNILSGYNEADRDQDYRFLSIADGTDHRAWGIQSLQAVRNRHYWNTTSRPIVDLSQGPITFIDPVSGTSRIIQPRWVVDSSRADTQQTDTSDFRYALASANLKFFKDRLVVLGAFRRDTYRFKVVNTMNQGDYPRDWDGQSRMERPGAPADYFGLKYTPKNAAGQPIGDPRPAVVRPRVGPNADRDPLYANDRFQDDYNNPVLRGGQNTQSFGTVLHLYNWFNPSINYAETFNPPDAIVRINGLLRPPTVAKGTDYGLRMEFFQRKLDLNFMYYESKEDHAVDFGVIPNFNSVIDANVVGDQSTTGRNIRGVGSLPNFRDTQVRQGQGVEVEVVWNPVKNIRLTGNYAKPKVGQGSRFPDTLAYITANAAVLKQIAQDAGVIIDANNIASVDQSIPVANRSPDAQSASDTYNAIFQFQNTYTGAPVQVGDAVESANFFADYTFSTGLLKGFRVGGGVNWRGRRAIGNRANDTIVNPANPLSAIDDPAVNVSTLVFAPGYSMVTATMAYKWPLKNRRELQANLVVENVLNDQGPLYLSTVLRPKSNNYASPAREAVPGPTFALKQPISYRFMVTLKM